MQKNPISFDYDRNKISKNNQTPQWLKKLEVNYINCG